MKTHARILDKLRFLAISFLGSAVFFLGFRVLASGFSDPMPTFSMVLLAVLLIAWCAVELLFLYLLLCSLETVRMDKDALRICLGPLILRRIPTASISAVAMSALNSRLYHRPTNLFLVLSAKPAEAMNSKGAHLLKSIPRISYMAGAGIASRGKNAGARAYLYTHFGIQPLWLEFSEEALQDLRHCLPGALYLMDPENK